MAFNTGARDRTCCASLTSKEDDDILVLLLHPLDDVSRLLGFAADAIGGCLSRTAISISHGCGLCPKLSFREIGERGKGDEDEDDEIRGI